MISSNNACPVTIQRYTDVVLAHGGGGRMTQQLIENMFLPAFGGSLPGERHDGVTFDLITGKFAFTTDSYVIQPLFFPGGDIGELAVYGTVNDLAMCGAKPLYLSAGFIIEEGFPMESLRRVALSMKSAAEAAGVRIVTGDTKVVNRGKGDGIFINTSGIGQIIARQPILPVSVRAEDAILLSGDIGRHGIAIMAVREGLEFESVIKSDCAPLNGIVSSIIESGIEIHCLRDLTRGGLAGALVEIAEAAGLCFEIREKDIPVREDVRGACEILGFDPLYVANEGRFAAFVSDRDAERALEIMRLHPLGKDAQIIGSVDKNMGPGSVTMRSRIGATRIVDMINGEQLPRIC